MLTNKMLECLNRQINRELYSAYLYLGMSSHASSKGLSGFANWFSVQVKEELTHAKKIYDYAIQHKNKVILQAIEAPPQDFSSPLDLFEKTLEHEKRVTKMIADLIRIAKEEEDRETESFLQWFAEEQVEEEESAGAVVEKIAKNSASGIAGTMKVDNELAKRKFSAKGGSASGGEGELP